MEERRPFKNWSDEENAIWQTLYERQYPRVQRRACQIYLEGIENMGLRPDRLPDYNELNVRFKELTGGWELISTDVQYSRGNQWFEPLSRKQFPITEYIRDRDSLNYTPLPDIWHDTFGHLAMMVNRRYADLVHAYAQLMLAYGENEKRTPLGNIWWYTIEFGMIREKGEVKTFGAGLMSSYEEVEYCFTDAVERLPFDPLTMGATKISPHALHKRLWILDSFEQLENYVHEQLRLVQREQAKMPQMG